MNEIALKPDSSSLLQRLQAMSIPVEQRQEESYCPINCQRAVALRNYAPLTCGTTIYHNLYNSRAEIDLSQHSIQLGAIAALDPLENPTLFDMRYAYGDAVACSWVVKHISLLNAASGASNRMDELSLNLCAMDIITSFYYLTLGEFCVFCARMRSLRYVKKRSDYVFSSDTIMMGLREFALDRKVELEKYEREHRPVVDMSKCMSHAQAIETQEYKDELKRLMKDAPSPKKEVVDRVKEIAHNFKVRPAMMSEEEFARKRERDKKRLMEHTKKRSDGMA